MNCAVNDMCDVPVVARWQGPDSEKIMSAIDSIPFKGSGAIREGHNVLRT